MCLKNTSTRYGTIAMGFHWGVGLLIIGMLAFGMMLESFEDTPLQGPMFGLHKSMGVVVLALVAARLLWRFISPPPAPLATQQPWEHKLAHAIHIVLYIGMLVMPISGCIMSAAAGRPVNFFGLGELPTPISPNKDLAGFARGVHGLFGNVMVAALLLHIGGAIKHHRIDKDETLLRMLPARWGKKAD